jgi:limonene-1,2-epoxide hydrolase
MSKQTAQPLTIVEEWHTALNNNDVERLTSLVHKDVKIGGPRGSATGIDVLLEWVDRAKVHLIPKRYFHQNEVVVVEELGQWHSAEKGEMISSQEVASIFIVQQGRIASIMRLDSLKVAFEASDLNESQEVAM